jgi:hypothetical protein
LKDAIGISSGTNGKIKTSGNTYVGCTGTIHPGTDGVFCPALRLYTRRNGECSESCHE